MYTPCSISTIHGSKKDHHHAIVVTGVQTVETLYDQSHVKTCAAHILQVCMKVCRAWSSPISIHDLPHVHNWACTVSNSSSVPIPVMLYDQSSENVRTNQSKSTHVQKFMRVVPLIHKRQFQALLTVSKSSAVPIAVML